MRGAGPVHGTSARPPLPHVTPQRVRVLESCLLDLQDFVDDLLVGQQLVLLISLALAQIRIKIGDEFPLVPLTSYGLGACRSSAFGALDIGNRSC